MIIATLFRSEPFLYGRNIRPQRRHVKLQHQDNSPAPPRGGTRVGQGSPDHALTLAYMPLGALIVALLSALFAVAFRLGAAPPLVSIAVFAVLLVAVGAATGQLRLSAAAGTRLTLAYLGLICLLAGVAAAPPADFPPLILWSLAAIAAAAIVILFVEGWISGKIGAAGPLSRRLEREAQGLLILSLALLLWRSGKAGGWVVAAGAVHYAVLVASLALPALRRDSGAVWRPYISTALAAALTLALLPVVAPTLAQGLAALAVLLAVVGPAADMTLRHP